MNIFAYTADDGPALAGATIIYAILFVIVSKSFNWKASIWEILGAGIFSGFISLALDDVIQIILGFTFGIFLGALHVIGLIERGFADTFTLFLDRIAFWFGSVGTAILLLWEWGVKGECYRTDHTPTRDVKFGYSKHTKKLGTYLAWLICSTLFVICIVQTNEIKKSNQPYIAKRLFKDLPSWSSVTSDPQFSSMTKIQRSDKFTAWIEKFYACAVDDSENISIEGWQQFKSKILRTREGILGFPENGVADIEAVEQQEEDDRLKLAARKIQLEGHIAGWLGLGRSRPELLSAEERQELEWLRGKVTKVDEETLEAVTAVREDKLLYFCSAVRFHASPSLRRDPEKIRDLIRKCNLSNRRKANALIVEYPAAGN